MYASLSHALSRIWKQEVAQDFRDGLIASERELQACLYSHLREELHATALGHARIFIEPTMKGADQHVLKRFPDMLICVPCGDESGMEVLAVVELKMDRGKFIHFENEFHRIIELGNHPEVLVKTESFPGESKWCTLKLSTRTRFFLGFLGSSDAEAVHKPDLCSSTVGAAFLKDHPDLAARTTLLFGRVHSDGATLFGSDLLAADSLGVLA